MKRNLSLVILTALSLCAAAVSAADNRIPYQGHLEKDRVPLNGPFDFQFRLFDVADAGTELWVESKPAVQVTAGAFSTTLGSVTAIPDAVMNRPALFIQISVKRAGDAAYVALAGRQQLLNVPKARGGWDPVHEASLGNFNGRYSMPVLGSTHATYKVFVSGEVLGIFGGSYANLSLTANNNLLNGPAVIRQLQPAVSGGSNLFAMLDKAPNGIPEGKVACEYTVTSDVGSNTRLFDGRCIHDSGSAVFTYANSGAITGTGPLTSIEFYMSSGTAGTRFNGRVTVLGLRQ